MPDTVPSIDVMVENAGSAGFGSPIRVQTENYQSHSEQPDTRNKRKEGFQKARVLAAIHTVSDTG